MVLRNYWHLQYSTHYRLRSHDDCNWTASINQTTSSCHSPMSYGGSTDRRDSGSQSQDRTLGRLVDINNPLDLDLYHRA